MEARLDQMRCSLLKSVSEHAAQDKRKGTPKLKTTVSLVGGLLLRGPNL